nr:unnamed protein product [Callosobruchus chinensis]
MSFIRFSRRKTYRFIHQRKINAIHAFLSHMETFLHKILRCIISILKDVLRYEDQVSHLKASASTSCITLKKTAKQRFGKRSAKFFNTKQRLCKLELSFFKNDSSSHNQRYSSIRPGRKPHDATINNIRVIKYDPSGTIQVKTEYEGHIWMTASLSFPNIHMLLMTTSYTKMPTRQNQAEFEQTLIDALKKKNVAASISNIIIESVTSSLTEKFNYYDSKIAELENEIVKLKTEYSHHNINTADNRHQQNVEQKLDNVQQQLKNNNIRIINVPEVAAENLTEKDNSVKMLAYNKKKMLKGTRMVIKEDLTALRLKIVKTASDKYGFKNVWTVNGKIFGKTETECRD